MGLFALLRGLFIGLFGLLGGLFFYLKKSFNVTLDFP